MYPQGLFMPRFIINAIKIKIFFDPQLFGDRRNVESGDIYTSRNPVWLGEKEAFFGWYPR